MILLLRNHSLLEFKRSISITKERDCVCHHPNIASSTIEIRLTPMPMFICDCYDPVYDTLIMFCCVISWLNISWKNTSGICNTYYFIQIMGMEIIILQTPIRKMVKKHKSRQQKPDIHKLKLYKESSTMKFTNETFFMIKQKSKHWTIDDICNRGSMKRRWFLKKKKK